MYAHALVSAHQWRENRAVGMRNAILRNHLKTWSNLSVVKKDVVIKTIFVSSNFKSHDRNHIVNNDAQIKTGLACRLLSSHLSGPRKDVANEI